MNNWLWVTVCVLALVVLFKGDNDENDRYKTS